MSDLCEVINLLKPNKNISGSVLYFGREYFMGVTLSWGLWQDQLAYWLLAVMHYEDLEMVI